MSEDRNTETHETFDTQMAFNIVDGKRFPYDVVAKFLRSIDIYKTLKGTRQMFRFVKELGYYKNDGEDHLEQRMYDVVGEHFNTQRFKEVREMVQVRTLVESDDFVPPVRMVNLQNGFYDLATNQFYEKDTKEDYSSLNFQNCLPFEYKPREYFYSKYGAPELCPNIDGFFHRVLGSHNDIDRMYEWFGFHLIRVYQFKKMAFFLGGTKHRKIDKSTIVK
jgi:phage/plasmid-associated DNA primase